MDTIRRWLSDIGGLDPGIQEKLATSLVIAGLFWLVRLFLVRLVNRSASDSITKYRLRQVATYITTGLATLLVFVVWLPAFGSIGVVLGVASAGFAIALRDPIANVAGWAFIVWRRPFQVGDRIEVGGHAGDVVDLRIFQFTLLEIGNWVDADQSTGRLVHLPNSLALSTSLANYTRSFAYIWDEIPVVITFESDWEKCKPLLQEIVVRHSQHLSAEAEKGIREASQRFMIFYNHLTPIVYTDVVDIGVRLTLRYLVEPRRRRTVRQEMWEDILRAFAAAPDIDLAYPTTRFYTLGEGASPPPGGTPP